MRVLTLTTLFPNHKQPNLGVFVRNRVVALANFAEVRVVAPVPWVPSFFAGQKAALFKSIAHNEQIAGLPTYHPRYVIIPKMLRPLYGELYFWSLASFMRKVHREYPFDIIDVHWAYPDGYAGVALANLLKIPVSVSLRGSDIHTYTRNPALRKLIGQTLSRADLIIAVAHSMVPLVEQLGISPERVLVVPNGVDEKIFCPSGREEARAKLDLKADSTILLAVGRLEKPKRFDLLVEACAQLRDETHTDLQLVIIGNGSLKEELRRLVTERSMGGSVLFAGEVENSDLAPWYCAADLFCLASDNEGCPNVLLESASCGIPIVASNVGGVPEFISRKNGVVVAENTADAWRGALSTALEARWEPGQVNGTVLGRNWEDIGRRVFDGFRAHVR